MAVIEEISLLPGNKSVMVCAGSNSACDKITERLVDVIHSDKLFRMYAKSYNYNKIKKRIEPVSNWRAGEFIYSSFRFFYASRISICTLSVSDYLTRAHDSENSQFDFGNFPHIIIDESASTHEPVTMIPITGNTGIYVT